MSDGPPSPGRPGHPRPHVRRAFLAASATVAALVMVISAVGMATYVWANGQRRTIQDFADPVPSGSPQPPESILGKCATHACNYLLLGSDSRQGLSAQEQGQFGTNADIGGSNRSDTIMLVHTRPGQKQATFLSFPRDMWVDIPGMGMGKINSAFEGGVDGGGPQRVARTVTQITGMQVHHVLYVDLAGFEGLVNALGGVRMCVPYPMQDTLTGLDIQAGCQQFDGATALAYVRTRHQPCDRIPDFARIGRQQQFLRAVISKLLQPGELLHLPSLVPRLLDNLVVDSGLNVADLVYLADQLGSVGTDNADFRSVPSIPDALYDSSGTYLSIVRMVQPQADELFKRLRDNQPLGDLGQQLEGVPPSPANIVVSVVDKHAGDAATEVERTLTDGGFNVSPGIVAGSAFDAPKHGGMILYREGAEAMAKVVGTYFPNLELVPAPANTLPSGQDVAVVVTSGYQIPPPSTGPQVECPS